MKDFTQTIIVQDEVEQSESQHCQSPTKSLWYKIAESIHSSRSFYLENSLDVDDVRFPGTELIRNCHFQKDLSVQLDNDLLIEGQSLVVQAPEQRSKQEENLNGTQNEIVGHLGEKVFK